MKIYYDQNSRPTPSKIHLATANKRILCTLNGIDEDSVELQLNGNNTCTLSFDVNQFVLDKDQNRVTSNGYELIDILMRIYVDNIGWFILDVPPSTSNDGDNEVKSVTAQSAEIEMVQHDLKNFKINCGTTDSYEMLATDNVEIIDEVEFAKEQIKFYNSENPELSLLDIAIDSSGLYGWSVGYVDIIPKEYKYYDDGELKTKYVALADEIGCFDISSDNLYSFLTQTVASYFECIFVFDIKAFEINVYRPENWGKNTNINIGFRNIQQSNEISVQDEVYTRFTVFGGESLDIRYVNFGSDVIECLDKDNFLNEKYLSADTIKKYKLWQDDLESYRPDYIEYTRLYNSQLSVISELHDRLPLDDCSTDWNTFSDEELLEAQANYEAQLKGYESYYVDENGDFDQEALDNSADANDYYQIKDVILPSIQIEMDNRELTSEDDKADYIDSYKTQWELYGLDELQVKLDEYLNIVSVCETGGYDIPYTEESGHTYDYHNQMYEKYLDAINQLNADFIGSCQEAYNQRKQEIDDATVVLDGYNQSRNDIVAAINKETWQNGEFSFSKQDLEDLSKVYVDADYTNEYMFLVSSDDSVSAIDEQLKLLKAAQDDAYIRSHKQYVYSTNLDNFLAKYEYKNYTDNLNIGDFIWLGVRDDYVAKLRAISISYNPLKMDNNLNIGFSNMVRSRSGRKDTSHLLNIASNVSKSSVSGSGGDYTTNEGVGLTSGLISKLVANGGFKNSINQSIEDYLAVYGNTIIAGSGGSGGSLTIEQLNDQMIKVLDITGDNAFFEYIQAKLISTDKIVADSGSFTDLDALVAKIDNLLAGNMVAELGHIIELTAQNVNIDEAVIRELIAAKISVDMLQAGTISTDQFKVASDDGGMEIVGNTMQFKDSNGNVRIQIGRDANNEFTFTLYNADGSGVLIDDTGIHESAIADGLIVNDMVADGTLGKEKFSFNIVEGDENGNIDAGKVLINGQGVDIEFTSIRTEISTLDQKIDASATYTLYIEMPQGNAITPSGIQMIAHLFKNSVEVTDDWDDSYFIWTRQSSDSYGDIYWNENHSTGTKILTITGNDLAVRASFQCKWETEQLTVVSA